MKPILLPTDFSEAADNAARYTVQLAKQLGGLVNLGYVADAAAFEGLNMGTGNLDTITVEPAVKALHQKLGLLCRALQDIGEGSVGVEYMLHAGYPEEEIVKMSEQLNPAIISMGTKQGKEGFDRLRGSVTAHVIENTNVPVLAIPNGVEFKPVEKILYASYFDSTDKDALLKLLRLFYPNEVELHVVYFFDDKGVQFPKEIYESVEQELHDHISPNYELAKVKVEVVESNDAIHCLNDKARDEEFQWLVTMTHKRTEITRVTDPSFTRQLMFLTEVPLLAFHHGN